MKLGRQWIPALFVPVLMACSIGLAQEDYFIRTHLSGDQVVGTVETEAVGTVTAVLVGEVLVVVGDYQNLSTPVDRLVAGGAHIHRGAAGENGGVAFRLNSDGGTAGGFTGIYALSGDEIDTLKSGGFYVQLHTESNQAGELRGQLAPSLTLADLVGVWERPAATLSSGTTIEASAVEITADRRFRYATGVEQLRRGITTSDDPFRLEGSLITFYDRHEMCSSPEPGSYQLEMSADGELHFLLHNDPCAAGAAELPRAAFVRVPE
ncbi:MAG: CHRD domain-containing protein [Trueperaceae bacterium]|nr:MAG: CHRD domain-containing protein [Trueperaceae bacterium]